MKNKYYVGIQYCAVGNGVISLDHRSAAISKIGYIKASDAKEAQKLLNKYDYNCERKYCRQVEPVRFCHTILDKPHWSKLGAGRRIKALKACYRDCIA